MNSKWYVLRQSQQTGPFSFAEMIQMLQKKMLRSHDYIWTPGLKAWNPLQQVRDFCPERIAQVYSIEKELFKKRQNPRIKINLPLWVHDNLELWPAKVTSLSIAGAGIQIASPTIDSGALVQFHFRNHKDLRAFNCKARILSKTYRDEITKHDSIVEYNAVFESLPTTGSEQINAALGRSR